MLCLLLTMPPLLQAQTLPTQSVTLQTLSQTLTLLENSLLQAKQQSQANGALLTSYRQKLDAYFKQVSELESLVDKLKLDNTTLTDSLNEAFNSSSLLKNKLSDLQAQVDKLEKDIKGLLVEIGIQKDLLSLQGNIIIGESAIIGVFVVYEGLRYFKIVK